MENLESAGKLRRIAEGNSENKTPIINARKNGYEGVKSHFSPDSSKLMALELIYNRLKMQSEFIIKTFDLELNLLWSKSFIDRDFKNDFISMKPLVDNQGNVHFTVETIDREKTALIFGINVYKYTLVSIDRTKQYVKKSIISLPENYLNELGMILTKNDDLFIAGFYSDKKGFYSSIGSYSLLLSPLDPSRIFKSIDEFGMDFLPKIEVEKAKKRQGILIIMLRIFF